MLNEPDKALWKKAEPLIRAKLLQPPSANELSRALALDPKRTEAFLVRVAKVGLAVRVPENRFFLPAGIQRYLALVQQLAAENQGAVTVAQLRDRAEVGRGIAVDVLEYFDKIKITRRVGAEHLLDRSV